MRILIFLFLCFYSISLLGNNLKITNVKFSDKNTSAGVNHSSNYTFVQFDISWDNSWKTTIGPANWDAAWVFAKYRLSSGDWKHIKIHQTGYAEPAGSTINVGLYKPNLMYNPLTNFGVGVFIYKNSVGNGNVYFKSVKFRWNYGMEGINDNELVDIRVYGIEMVYVPTGSFYAGDGSTSSVQGNFSNGLTNTPLRITSEMPLIVGGINNGNLTNNKGISMTPPDDFNDTSTQILPLDFPKGFKGFYCMKYEITQQQYVDFLNALNRNQQSQRTGTPVDKDTVRVLNVYVMNQKATSEKRNSIRCDSALHPYNSIEFYCDLNGNGRNSDIDEGRNIACNYLNFMDIAAYLDWSGLRPMTELEYEKACRGSLIPVANEYAWGNTQITMATDLVNKGENCETVLPLQANASFNNPVNIDGPLRVGIFAKPNSDRTASGSSFYGIMEMSGNLYERTVTVGNRQGRLYTGNHGNGTLAPSGNANELNWPGYDTVSNEIKNADGSGFRGGVCVYSSLNLRISARAVAARGNYYRHIGYGGRGVRTIPKL